MFSATVFDNKFNVYKFVDHIKTIDADMILKTSEFKRNLLDYVRYQKPNKQIKQGVSIESFKTRI